MNLSRHWPFSTMLSDPRPLLLPSLNLFVIIVRNLVITWSLSISCMDIHRTRPPLVFLPVKVVPIEPLPILREVLVPGADHIHKNFIQVKLTEELLIDHLLELITHTLMNLVIFKKELRKPSMMVLFSEEDHWANNTSSNQSTIFGNANANDQLLDQLRNLLSQSGPSIVEGVHSANMGRLDPSASDVRNANPDHSGKTSFLNKTQA